MDLKLFVQRFIEFVHLTENTQELHDFVAKLMSSNFIINKEAQIQFVKNMMGSVTGAKGIEDDLTFLSIFEIILSRLIPEDDDELKDKAAGNNYTFVKMKKKNDELKAELK